MTITDQPNLHNKSLLLVNTGSINKKEILLALKKLELKRLIILNSSMVSWADHITDDWIIADTNNHEESIKKVLAYNAKHPIDGVITFWEDDVLLTSKLRDILHLKGIPYAIADKARNKYHFRSFCTQHALPAPNHILISTPQDVEKALNLSFPVVIKPIYGANSSFVVKVNTKDELNSVYSFIKKSISPSVESALHEGSDLMIEEYIDGDEVDIDILLQNGKIKFWSITDDYQTEEPFFLDNGQAIPSDLPQKSQHELIEMAEIVLEKLGITDACIHFEAKYTSKGPIPLEVNLRLGGGVYSFIKHVWHINMVENAVKIACGIYMEKVKKPELPYQHLAIGVLAPKKSGVVTSLSIPEDFKKKYKAKDLYIYKEVGDGIFTPPSGYEYLGWLSIPGDNSIDARENLDIAMKNISYEIVPFSGTSAIGKTKRKSPFSSAYLQPYLARRNAKMEKLKYMDLKKQRELTIGIASNYYAIKDGLVESAIGNVGPTIETALKERGYKTLRIDLNHLSTTVEVLEKQQVDLVFNVAELLNNSALFEAHIASLYATYQIPFTGSPMLTLALCQDKIRVKKLLTYHDIPTAKWDYLYNIDDTLRDDLAFPLIVKVANADNSIGLTNESVVTNKKDLTHRIEYVMKELKRPVLIEEYLEGDEYDVSILGNYDDEQQILPLSRSIFHLPDGYWNIYPFAAKYKDSEIYKKGITVERPPKKVNKKLLSLISEIALDTYNILDCHDYGRVEVKLDKEGNPHVLELNPNASIDKGDCIPTVASLAGLNYGDFIERIITHAIGRYKKV